MSKSVKTLKLLPLRSEAVPSRGLTDLDGDLTGMEAYQRTGLCGLTGVVLRWDVQEEERLADAGAKQDFDDDNLFAPTKVNCVD